ncbi:hypothetical protein KKHLCK_16295 [Candidatus Electrothrix laxa]
MNTTYNVRVTKDFSENYRVFCAGDILRGTFKRLDNYDYFVSNSFCIKPENVDKVNIVSYDVGLPVLPALPVISIISLFFSLAVFLVGGLSGLISLCCFFFCFNILLLSSAALAWLREHSVVISASVSATELQHETQHQLS